MQRSRHHRGIETLALKRLAARNEPVDIDRPGRPALADDRSDPGLRLRIDEDQGLAAQAVEILLDHPSDEERRDARVEGVASLEKNLERGGGGKGMARRNSGGRPDDRRPHRGRTGLGKVASQGGRLRGRRRGRQRDQKNRPEPSHRPGTSREKHRTSFLKKGPPRRPPKAGRARP